MKKASVAFFSLSLLLLIGLAVVGDRNSSFLYPVAWVTLIILPPLYLVLYKASGKKLVFVLVYAMLTFVLLIAQGQINVTSDVQMGVGGLLLLVLQAGLWAQYYFTDRHKPEALTQGGNFAKAEADKIRNLITDGDLEEAMDRMTAGDELSAEQQTVVSNFAFRLSEIQQKETMGLLTGEEVSVARNKIVTGILSFL